MGFLDSLATADLAIRDRLGEVSVIYTPSAGPPVTVTAIFDVPFTVVAVGDAGVASGGPVVWFVLADLPDTALTDRLAIITRGTKTYQPWELQPDGQGSIRMLCHEVS